MKDAHALPCCFKDLGYLLPYWELLPQVCSVLHLTVWRQGGCGEAQSGSVTRQGCLPFHHCLTAGYLTSLCFSFLPWGTEAVIPPLGVALGLQMVRGQDLAMGALENQDKTPRFSPRPVLWVRDPWQHLPVELLVMMTVEHLIRV